MMAQTKKISILMIKVEKLFPLFSSLFSKKSIEKMFSVFLSSYRNTPENMGELEKLVPPNFHSCFYKKKWHGQNVNFDGEIISKVLKENDGKLRRKLIPVCGTSLDFTRSGGKTGERPRCSLV